MPITGASDWVIDTSYWINGGNSGVLNGNFASDPSVPWTADYLGLRPALTVSKSRLRSEIMPGEGLSGTKLDQGQEVCFTGIPTEKFMVLFDSTSDNETVKIISKYNVNTGVEPYTQGTDNTTYPVAFDSAKLVQSTYVYASDYVGSDIEKLVNLYINGKLNVAIAAEAGETKGLLSKEDLESLDGGGALSHLTSLTGTPSWVKNTSFWLGTATSSDSFWALYMEYGAAVSLKCNVAGYMGVRPVLTVSKSRLSLVNE